MGWMAKITDKVFLHLTCGLGVLVMLLFLPQIEILPIIYFRTQDALVALVLCAALAMAAIWLPRTKLPVTAPTWTGTLAFAGALVLVLWVGTYLVMFDYPLTRDEHMVVFDAGVFAGGELVARLPSIWNGYAEALVPAFLLDVPDNALLISAYI